MRIQLPLVTLAIGTILAVVLLARCDGEVVEREPNDTAADAVAGAHLPTDAARLALNEGEESFSRRAAQQQHAPIASSTAALERWVVVENGTLTPVAGARVRCVDSRGISTEQTTADGTFELTGTAPFVLEVSAPEHSPRWLVAKDSTPVAIDLWRAGSVEVLVVDEVDRPLEGVDVSLVSEARVRSNRRAFEYAFRADAESKSRARYVDDAVALEDGGATDHYSARATFSVGPTRLPESRTTDANGRAQFDGLPAGTRFAVETSLFEVHSSEPAGELVRRGSIDFHRTGFAELTASGLTQFRFVRRGSCALTFDLVGRTATSTEDHERVRLLYRDPTEAAATWSPADTLVHRRHSDPRAHWRGPTIGFSGLQPGEYALVAEWSRPWSDPRRAEPNFETCIVERVLALEHGRSLDLGPLDADPGIVDYEFFLVDDEGAPLAFDQLVGPTSDVHEEHSDENLFFVGVVGDLTTLSTILGIDPWTVFEFGSVTAHLRIRGAPFGIPALKVKPGYGAHPASTELGWLLSGPTEHEFTPSRDQFHRIPIQLLAARDIEITLAHTPSIDSVATDPEPDPERADFWLRRESDGRWIEFESEWTLEEPARLMLRGQIPLGTWSVASPLVHARTTEYSGDDGAASTFGFFERDFVASSADWYRFDEPFDVTIDGPNTFVLQAALAATLRLKLSKIPPPAPDEEYDDDIPDEWGTLEIVNDLGAWSPAPFFTSDAVDHEGGDTIVVCGLPPNSRLRFAGLASEFRTGPPGSIVEVNVPDGDEVGETEAPARGTSDDE